jgi:hypothetical protein
MRFILTTVAMLLLCTSQAFGQRTWNNSANDNNFANGANWTGWAGGFTGSNQNWDINQLGANRAILSTAVGNVQRDVRVGDAGGQGELEVTATGSMTVTRDLRLARAGTSTGQAIMTVNGGSVTVNEQIFIGQSNNPGNPTIFTLNSGSVSAGTTLNVAHQAGNRGNLVINGGSFTAANAVLSDSGNTDSPSFASLTVTGGSLTTTTGSFTFASSGGGNTATVNLSGTGTITSATSMSFGFGANSTANLNMSGGTLNALTGFIGFGQGDNANVTVTMSDGVINTERMGFANSLTATATLNMTGGVINLAQNGGTASHSGGLRMQGPGATLNIGGDALVNAQKLYINDGGLLNLSGDALIDISGSTDGTNATFDFSIGLVNWSQVNGEINFASTGALLRVAGESENIAGPVNFVNLFNGAIANGVFTHSVAGGSFNVGFDGTYSFVQVVPEPSSLALFGLVGCIFGLRRHRRNAVDTMA